MRVLSFNGNLLALTESLIIPCFLFPVGTGQPLFSGFCEGFLWMDVVFVLCSQPHTLPPASYLPLSDPENALWSRKTLMGNVYIIAWETPSLLAMHGFIFASHSSIVRAVKGGKIMPPIQAAKTRT